MRFLLSLMLAVMVFACGVLAIALPVTPQASTSVVAAGVVSTPLGFTTTKRIIEDQLRSYCYSTPQLSKEEATRFIRPKIHGAMTCIVVGDQPQLAVEPSDVVKHAWRASDYLGVECTVEVIGGGEVPTTVIITCDNPAKRDKFTQTLAKDLTRRASGDLRPSWEHHVRRPPA